LKQASTPVDACFKERPDLDGVNGFVRVHGPLLEARHAEGEGPGGNRHHENGRENARRLFLERTYHLEHRSHFGF
jgi:hypothetical protein